MPRLFTLALLGLASPALAADFDAPVDGGQVVSAPTDDAGVARRGASPRGGQAHANKGGRSRGNQARGGNRGTRGNDGRSARGDRPPTESNTTRPRDGTARPPEAQREQAGLGSPDRGEGSDRVIHREDRQPTSGQRPESRPQSRPESRPQSRPESRPQSRPQGHRPPAQRPQARPPARPAQPAARPPARPPARPGARPAAPQVARHYRAPVRYRWYHGVFVYGPRPVYHTRYVGSAPRTAPVQAHLPDRAVDRNASFAIGLRGGSYLSDSSVGPLYSDASLGLTARYRPVESFGLEAAVSHADQSWSDDSLRSQTLVQGSAMLFAAPWSRVSPYVLGGLTYNDRGTMVDYAVDQEVSDDQVRDLFGLHAGAGLEIAIGPSVALDLEGRYVHYLNTSEDPAGPGAIQGNVGLLFHF